MSYSNMYVNDNNIVMGENDKGVSYPLFNNIYISEIGTDLATGEQIANVVMENGSDVAEKVLPMKDVTAENINSIFRGYGFKCSSSKVKALDEWLMYHSSEEADVFDCYRKIGYLETKEGETIYCYPDVVEAEYIGDKDYSAQGNMDDWLELVKELHNKNPMIVLPLAISLSAPVVSRLRYSVGTENLLVSLSGLTSTGKTTTMKLMASIWGKPYLGKEGLLDNLNTTLNALQSKLNNTQGAPVFLDETSSNKNIDYQQMVYELADGLSKCRANSQGDAREQYTWNTTIIMTTEGSLVNSLDNAGSKARLLDIPLQFYKDKESVEKVRSLVPFCYGHIAKYFLKKLAKVDDKEFFEMYQESADRLREENKGEFPQEYYRMLDRIAIIDATAQIMQRLKMFEFIQQSDFDAAYKELAKNYQSIIMDEDQSMLEILQNKVQENLKHFHLIGFPNQYSSVDRGRAYGSCYGKVVYSGDCYVAYIMCNIACEWLKLSTTEAKTVFARWKHKKILVQTTADRTQYRTTIEGRKVYTYAIEIEKADKMDMDFTVKRRKNKKQVKGERQAQTSLLFDET